MKKFIILLLFVFAVKANALLPPLYQSLKEIDAIISNEQLKEELGSAEAVLEIKRVKDGYLVLTRQYMLKVEVIYIPRKIIGPAKFELRFHEKEPRKMSDDYYHHHEYREQEEFY